MSGTYARFLRTRRGILGLSQRDLAERAGVKQPLIAAIESGRRRPSEATRAALDAVLALRPSEALAARRAEIGEAFALVGLPAPRVFGSVARGDDGYASDLDLIVEFSGSHDIVDLLTLQDNLQEILTVGVDIVDASASGDAVQRALAEAVEL
jgi:predicted nucleotidyltransferase